MGNGCILTQAKSTHMTELHTPDKEQINLLEAFDRLDLNQIYMVTNADQAAAALDALKAEKVLGFDTESKPTFAKNEASTGPHIVQLSTLQRAWIFQLDDPECRRAVGVLLESPHIVKAGFGLGDDKKRITYKLGVDLQGVLDLNTVFKAKGYRKDMGVRGAVAVLFNKRFIKSKKASTSNWANPQLTEAQIIYAANDAYAAMRVYAELGL
jgi:ribonuclease D